MCWWLKSGSLLLEIIFANCSYLMAITHFNICCYLAEPYGFSHYYELNKPGAFISCFPNHCILLRILLRIKAVVCHNAFRKMINANTLKYTWRKGKKKYLLGWKLTKLWKKNHLKIKWRSTQSMIYLYKNRWTRWWL